MLIGLTVTRGFALVDTGAQHGVIGPKQREPLKKRLSAQGLKPKRLETFKLKAFGLGGEPQFLESAEVPLGIAKTSAVMHVHVLDQDLPLLLPFDFSKKLGMVSDAPQQTITWTRLGGRTSDVNELSGSGRLAKDILDFPGTGWIHPCQADMRNCLRANDLTADRAVFDEHFRIAPFG